MLIVRQDPLEATPHISDKVQALLPLTISENKFRANSSTVYYYSTFLETPLLKEMALKNRTFYEKIRHATKRFKTMAAFRKYIHSPFEQVDATLCLDDVMNAVY